MGKLISVVMPSYNVGKYIKECIESVMHQTYANLEIIVVDAGSTDGTKEIIESLQEKDSRIRRIDSEKKSYGYQVNLGIAESRGDYISIIETDDVIEKDMMETLLSLMEESNADYVSGQAESFSKFQKSKFYTLPIRVFTSEEFEKNCDEKKDGKGFSLKTIEPKKYPEILIRDYYLWNKLYRRDFVKNIKLHETPKAAYQDIGFLFQVYMNANKAVYTNKLVYHYRKDNMGASGYNLDAFRFLITEYEFVDKLFCEKHDIEEIENWRRFKSRKWYRQFVTRVKELSWLDVEIDKYLMDAKECVYKLSKENERNHFIEEETSFYKEIFYEAKHDLISLFVKERNQAKESREMMKALKKWCGQSEVIVFGAGSYGRLCTALLLKNKIQVVSICDNGKTDVDIFGVRVLLPTKIDSKDAKYIISSNKYYDEMYLQLKEIGVLDKNIWNKKMQLSHIQMQLDT